MYTENNNTVYDMFLKGVYNVQFQNLLPLKNDICTEQQGIKYNTYTIFGIDHRVKKYD